MEYTGRIYGKTGGKYFDTGYTTNDWNDKDKRIEQLEEANKVMNEQVGEYRNSTIKASQRIQQLEEIAKEVYYWDTAPDKMKEEIEELLNTK